jgi:tricorn protease
MESGSRSKRAPFLLREPTLSRLHVAFSYGGNIWIANRDGSDLRRLTADGHEFKPAFSPDGTQIAYIGEYGGSRGVFVVPVAGGESRRLTHHPADLGVGYLMTGDAVGWTPDGARVLFSSHRLAFAGGVLPVVRLFTVPAEGGFATPLPLIRAAQGVFSPDATRMAYVPHAQYQPECKRYRGGQARSILIADLAEPRIEAKIPRDRSNDFNPMWVDDTIYFLSDRNGPVTLFAYDVRQGEVRQLVKNEGFDIKAASACSHTIAYEQFGSLHLFDVRSGEHCILDIRPAADFPEVRARVENASDRGLTGGAFEKIKPRLSPTGARAVFSIRGRIVTAPAEHGDLRVLTQGSGVAERDPAWSPDGTSIAYFSDECGEYALHIRDQYGIGAVRKIDLGSTPTFYYGPRWSPDSRKIAYTDQRLNYWYVDVDTGVPVRIDSNPFTDPGRRSHDLQLS